MRGIDRFRSTLATFLQNYVLRCRHVPINPEHLCVSTGVGSLLNHLAHAICEKGQGLLVPAPSYASFDFDLKVGYGR